MRARVYIWRSTDAAAIVTVAMLASAVVIAGQGQAKKKSSFPCETKPGSSMVAFHKCALPFIKSFNPRRTPDGKPDMSGYWQRNHFAETVEAHPMVLGVPVPEETMVYDPASGHVPLQPWAEEFRKKHHEGSISPTTFCAPSGPRLMYFGDTQILQQPNTIVMFQERFHQYRIIPLNGPPPLGKSIELWQGDARGWWEGNTLVVRVQNFNGIQTFDHNMHFATKDLVITERFTLVDNDVIHWEALVEDPKVFTQPWKMVMPLTRNPDPTYETWEEGCFEGLLDLHNIFGAGFKLYHGVPEAR